MYGFIKMVRKCFSQWFYPFVAFESIILPRATVIDFLNLLFLLC